MWYLTGMPVLSGDISWQHSKPEWDKEDGIRIGLRITSFSKLQKRNIIQTIVKCLEDNKVEWLIPCKNKWIIDAEKLKEFIPEFSELIWFKGKIKIEPEFESEEKDVFGQQHYFDTVALYVIPGEIEEMTNLYEVPIEISESLKKFQNDFPNPSKVAFIIMRFTNTEAHKRIVSAIKDTLSKFGITGIRADEKQYHDDLFPNILTYIFGCGFGVSVFERIETDDFNPNVSLEVGYMFGLKKPVVLLKDKTLKTLHSDLVGKLYKNFDTQDPNSSIPVELERWLSDKELI